MGLKEIEDDKARYDRSECEKALKCNLLEIKHYLRADLLLFFGVWRYVDLYIAMLFGMLHYIMWLKIYFKKLHG